MTTITLESDSSHSPPVMHKSNKRSSSNHSKFVRNTPNLEVFCENSRTLVENFPVRRCCARAKDASSRESAGKAS